MISRVKVMNSLGDDADISEACICQRSKRARLFLEDNKAGTISPRRVFEMKFVQVLIQMVKMR